LSAYTFSRRAPSAQSSIEAEEKRPQHDDDHDQPENERRDEKDRKNKINRKKSIFEQSALKDLFTLYCLV
jgi:hypothetical protein